MHHLAMDFSSAYIRAETEPLVKSQKSLKEDLNLTKKKKYKPSAGCQEPYLTLNDEDNAVAVSEKKLKGFLKNLFSPSTIRTYRRSQRLRSFNEKKQGQAYYMKIELEDSI